MFFATFITNKARSQRKPDPMVNRNRDDINDLMLIMVMFWMMVVMINDSSDDGDDDCSDDGLKEV